MFDSDSLIVRYIQRNTHYRENGEVHEAAKCHITTYAIRSFAFPNSCSWQIDTY